MVVEIDPSLIEDIYYHMNRYDSSTSKVSAAHHLSELNDRISDLASFHPTYDYNTGTLGYEREDEAFNA